MVARPVLSGANFDSVTYNIIPAQYLYIIIIHVMRLLRGPIYTRVYDMQALYARVNLISHTVWQIIDNRVSRWSETCFLFRRPSVVISTPHGRGDLSTFIHRVHAYDTDSNRCVETDARNLYRRIPVQLYMYVWKLYIICYYIYRRRSTAIKIFMRTSRVMYILTSSVFSSLHYNTL